MCARPACNMLTHVSTHQRTHTFFCCCIFAQPDFFRRRHRNGRERGRDRVKSVVVHCLSGMSQKLRNRPRINILGVHIERVRPHRMKNITALPTLRTFRRKWYQTVGYFLGPFGTVKGQGQCRVSCPLHFRDGSKVEEQTGEKHTKSSRVQNERVCPHPMKNITALPTFGQE